MPERHEGVKEKALRVLKRSFSSQDYSQTATSCSPRKKKRADAVGVTPTNRPLLAFRADGGVVRSRGLDWSSHLANLAWRALLRPPRVVFVLYRLCVSNIFSLTSGKLLTSHPFFRLKCTRLGLKKARFGEK